MIILTCSERGCRTELLLKWGTGTPFDALPLFFLFPSSTGVLLLVLLSSLESSLN